MEIENSQIVREIKICGHLFHDSCIEKWLQVKEECPLCKLIISQESLNEGGNYNVLAPLEPIIPFDDSTSSSSTSTSSCSSRSYSNSTTPSLSLEWIPGIPVPDLTLKNPNQLYFPQRENRPLTPLNLRSSFYEEDGFYIDNFSEDWNFKPLMICEQRLNFIQNMERADELSDEIQDLMINDLAIAYSEGSFLDIARIKAQIDQKEFEMKEILND